MSARDDGATPGPAGYWQRHAAWSLDAMLVALPVVPFAVAAMQRQGPVVITALRQLASHLAVAALASLQSGDAPSALATQLAADPAFDAAVGMLRVAVCDAMCGPVLAFVALAAAYWPAFEGSSWQATPGKRALDLVVRRAAPAGRAGQAAVLGHGRALARHVAGIASWLTGNLGHALAALPPGKRALHDRIAGTQVMQRAARATLPAWARGWLLLQALVVVVLAWWAAGALADVMRNAMADILAG